MQEVTDDPIYDASQTKKNKFIATATDKQKFRLAMIDYVDSIKSYNSSISRLVKFGLTESTIKLFFDAQYLDINTEVNNMYKGLNLNLQSSGVGEIPILDPGELTTILNTILNMNIRTDNDTRSTRMRAIIDRFTTVRQGININTEVLIRAYNNFQNVSDAVTFLQAMIQRVQSIVSPSSNPLVTTTQNIQGYVSVKDLLDAFKKRLKTIEDGGGADADQAFAQSIKDLLTVIINYISQFIDVDQTVRNVIALNKKSGEYKKIANLLIGAIDANALTDIRYIITEFLKANINQNQSTRNWTFTENELKQGENIKKPDDGTIEDRTYRSIIDVITLTQEQQDILIKIIENLSKKLVTDEIKMNDDVFFTGVQNIFIEINNEIVQSITDNITFSGLFTNILNTINSNFETLNTIFNLITKPTETISTVIRDIIDSALTTYDEGQLDIIQSDIKPVGQSVPVADATSSSSSASLLSGGVPIVATDEDEFETWIINDYSYSTVEQRNIQKEETRIRATKALTYLSTDYGERKYDDPLDIIIRNKINKAYDDVIYDDVIKENNIIQGNDNVEEKKEDEIKQNENIISRIRNIINRIKPKVNVRQKLQRVMNELRNKFKKFKLVRRYAVQFKKSDGTIERKAFSTNDEARAWLAERGVLDIEMIVKIKYGLVRDVEENVEEDVEEPLPPPGPPGPPGPPPDGGGDPSGGRNRRNRRIVRRIRTVFNGLTRKEYLLLLISIIFLSVSAVSLDDIFKKNNDVDDKGKTTPPDKTPDKTPGGNIPSGGDNMFNKINHNSIWDSVGLGEAIDTYNSLLTKYYNLPKSQQKAYEDTLAKYYKQFSDMTQTPELNELINARKAYDGLKLAYDNAMSNGASYDTINGIYNSLKTSILTLNTLSDKYVDLENGRFGWRKTKDSPDVTIDDIDTSISMNTKLSTGKGGKAIKDTSYALLSKGMLERIKRKMQGGGDFSSGIIAEQQDFINYSLIPPNAGLGTAQNNPLIYRNLEYDRIKYLNCNKNPESIKQPNINQLIKNSKQKKPQLHNVIQLDDTMNYENGNKMINQKLYNELPTPNAFSRSRLYNPEYHTEELNKQKLIQTGNDMIGRGGPYYGLSTNENQYYQYGSIQYKQNEDLNKYQGTYPKIHYTKERRKLPNTYSLK